MAGRPETGISIGELQRFLKSWLGHDTHITGEVWRTQNGIAVTARESGEAGATSTGPESDLDGLMQKAAEHVYSTNYLIDLDNAIIVDVEASTAIRQAKVTAAKTMIERTDKRFSLYPERLAADTAYGSGEMLDWLVHERGFEPHIPVFDKSKRTDDTFSRGDFTYDHEGDAYFCPGGKMLTCKGTLVNDGDTLMYRASKYDCSTCSLKTRCCPNTPARRVPRSIYEGARDITPCPADSERRSRCCSRTSSASCASTGCEYEAPVALATGSLLAATAQNLGKLAKLIPVPQAAAAI